MYRTVLMICLSGAVAIAGDTPTYQKGTVAKKFAAESEATAQAYYELRGEDRTYQIKICADFNDGKSVDFRVKGSNVFVRSDAGKDIKCPIEIISGKPVSYKKGTVEGFDTRKDYYSNGNGSMSYRKAKVYALRGPDMTYRVDYCGAFQAGEFTPGQVIDYRIDGDRLYILHDAIKEYSCKIEGTRLPENANPAQ